MYQEFSIISIDAITKSKQIIVTANKAINENNNEGIIIQVYERETKTPVLFDYDIDFESLVITLKEWPIPNTDYILGVSGITSVTDDSLDTNIKKRLKFDSNVVSEVKITSPAVFEEIQKLEIKLVETADMPESLVNLFYVEVATDNAFFNVTNKATIDKDNMIMFLKETGQYFIRARVQVDESNYSIWSETISFIYGSKDITPAVPTDEEAGYIDIDTDLGDDEEPEIDISDPFTIVEYPEQGVTPEEGMLIVFSNYLNDMSIDNIVITRKDVR
jgi:hypothetical protein